MENGDHKAQSSKSVQKVYERCTGGISPVHLTLNVIAILVWFGVSFGACFLEYEYFCTVGELPIPNTRRHVVYVAIGADNNEAADCAHGGAGVSNNYRGVCLIEGVN